MSINRIRILTQSTPDRVSYETYPVRHDKMNNRKSLNISIYI
jgi:hypothetical protein